MVQGGQHVQQAAAVAAAAAGGRGEAAAAGVEEVWHGTVWCGVVVVQQQVL